MNWVSYQRSGWSGGQAVAHDEWCVGSCWVGAWRSSKDRSFRVPPEEFDFLVILFEDTPC
jgi:hypothetical protein